MFCSITADSVLFQLHDYYVDVQTDVDVVPALQKWVAILTSMCGYLSCNSTTTSSRCVEHPKTIT